MRQLEKNDKSSKSLLANVLDLEDDFLICSGGANMSKPGKNDYFETLPTLIPHSTTYPNASSEINISSASVDSSYSRKHSQNFTSFLGILQHPKNKFYPHISFIQFQSFVVCINFGFKEMNPLSH